MPQVRRLSGERVSQSNLAHRSSKQSTDHISNAKAAASRYEKDEESRRVSTSHTKKHTHAFKEQSTSEVFSADPIHSQTQMSHQPTQLGLA